MLEITKEHSISANSLIKLVWSPQQEELKKVVQTGKAEFFLAS